MKAEQDYIEKFKQEQLYDRVAKLEHQVRELKLALETLANACKKKEKDNAKHCDDE